MFLPTTKQEMDERGWQALDIIIVTGDAYVDHPSFGAALIARLLEHAGFRVGIISQPDCRTTDDFKKLGRPRLFLGVTAGNLDSMVANYTANRNRRRQDEYSPANKVGLRPDRASIVYTNKIKQAFPTIPVVLGGMEASLRRLAHYDYWSDKVRRSILLDAKADILVYGMGERQILEIAQRLQKGENIRSLDNIRGTVVARNTLGALENYIEVPSFEEAATSPDAFNEAFKTAYAEFDAKRGRPIVQKHAGRLVICFAPALPLSTPELDELYALPFMRAWHPCYDTKGGVPALEPIKFSITSHRGCPGECSFCSLYMHQGRVVASRSKESIVKEAAQLSEHPDFKGTITDIGGPTANMYQAACESWQASGACKNKKCLLPTACEHLHLGNDQTLALWAAVTRMPKVKHLFIGSGLRYDLLLARSSKKYFQQLCAHHISGQLKVAPEHNQALVLALMNKPSFGVYERFCRAFEELNTRLRKKQFLVNYFISAHPGATLQSALALSLELMKRHIYPEQIQDFLPLPMTISGCMFHTKKDPITAKPVYVSTGLRERKMQRALIQYKAPGNKKYVIEALRSLGRMDLAPRFRFGRGRRKI